MNRGNFFRRTLLTLLTVSIMLFATVVGAKIQMYTATGEDYPSAAESQDISKQRALDKAIKKATKQSGVYLKTYSRSVNSELTDDEVTAITSNAWQLVGEPKFTREIINHSDDTQIIVWKATVEVNVDDSEIQSWIKRDDKDKSMIITQTREVQKASEENDRQIEDLREKYNRATSKAEKDKIIKQMNDADRDFLAIQKLEEGNKFLNADRDKIISMLGQSDRDFLSNHLANQEYYTVNTFLKNYRLKGAVKFFNEAIEINPSLAESYYCRGWAYKELGFESYSSSNRINEVMYYRKAIDDFTKVIELKPDYIHGYRSRGSIYYDLEDWQKAIDDYTKLIELDPNTQYWYNFRGICYKSIGEFEKAEADFKKTREIAHSKGETAIVGIG